jgi:hypothetical protein
MPTGYTAIIEEKADLTFREFALRCARAMGACVMQRDDPADDPPKVPEPSECDAKRKREAEAKLIELRGLSAEGARALWQADCEHITKKNAESVAEAKELERRYARMRAMVTAWAAPADHEGLRRFMLEQIDMCKSDWTPYIRKAAETPGDWLAGEIKASEWTLEYSAKHAAEELERTADRKRWIDALYASL